MASEFITSIKAFTLNGFRCFGPSKSNKSQVFNLDTPLWSIFIYLCVCVWGGGFCVEFNDINQLNP